MSEKGREGDIIERGVLEGELEGVLEGVLALRVAGLDDFWSLLSLFCECKKKETFMKIYP